MSEPKIPGCCGEVVISPVVDEASRLSIAEAREHAIASMEQAERARAEAYELYVSADTP